MNEPTQELRYSRTRKDGRVECINIWRTGFVCLVVRDQEAFEQLKKKVEEENYIPWPVAK